MVVITASMVASLRATTGLGMMECKKALVESNGDMRQAEDILRIRSGHKASKLAHRSAKEGLVAASIDQTIGVLVEINCETDFVAKDANFVAFAQQIIKTIQQANPVDIAALHTILTDQGVTVEALRQEAIAKMGENISIRRFVRYKTDHQLASYLHGNKIGVLVDYRGGDAPLGHDIAMHIAACKPLCVDKSDVPAAVLAREKHIYQEQAAQSGKPMDIIDKMVSGRITKFLAEVTLLGQTFVKEQEMTVGDLLRKKQATVNRFAFFAVGEGLESQFE
ncbi:MAG: elongation factor Ts [Neisseriales bacterium]|nr:MAG: elongation factor Ts [Neisseriales bacterium]